MKTVRAAAILSIVLAPGAWAIHVEPDQPDLQNPKAQLVEAARAAEESVNGSGATSISSSGFTGFNATVKRKPFPPGYGRSGYQFEDELTGPPAAPEPAAAPADATPVQPDARKP
jgi:hypothetical protein